MIITCNSQPKENEDNILNLNKFLKKKTKQKDKQQSTKYYTEN
jgi:hypothetical protein